MTPEHFKLLAAFAAGALIGQTAMALELYLVRRHNEHNQQSDTDALRRMLAEEAAQDTASEGSIDTRTESGERREP